MVLKLLEMSSHNIEIVNVCFFGYFLMLYLHAFSWCVNKLGVYD